MGASPDPSASAPTEEIEVVTGPIEQVAADPVTEPIAPVPGAALTEAVETGAAEPTAAGSALSGLFGRSMSFVLVTALPFVTATVVSPVLAYALGPREFGLMASAIALHQVFVCLAMVGFDQALVLQRAEDGDDRSTRKLIAAGATLACLVTLVLGVTGPLWSRVLGFDGFDSLVVATVLWTAPAVVVALVLAALLGEDRLGTYMTVSVISTVGSQLIGLLLLFTVDRSVATYAWGGVWGQVAACAVALVVVLPDLRGLLDVPLVRTTFRLGIPLMLSGLSAFVLNAGDRLIVQSLMGSAEAGRYQVAYTVGFVAVTVLVLTGNAWSAPIAAVRDDAERLALIGKARDGLYGLLAPIILGIVLGAPFLLRVLAPPEFDPAPLLPVVLVVVMSGIPVVAYLASDRVLITRRRTSVMAIAVAVAAAGNIGLNLLLVPWLGLLGAAAATLVALTVQAVLQRYAAASGGPWPRVPRRLVLLLGAACVLAAASTLLPQDPWWWIAGRMVGAVACLAWMLVDLRRLARPAPEKTHDVEVSDGQAR